MRLALVHACRLGGRVVSSSLMAVLLFAESYAQFGPSGIDSAGFYIGNQARYNLRDIRSTGTLLSLGDDQAMSVPVGFHFPLYGLINNTAHVSSNGILSFTSNSHGCCNSEPLPTANLAGNAIAGAWTDLDPTEGGQVYYETRGEVGSREFIVGFYDVQHNRDITGSSTPSTFEIILHEGTDTIELQYADLQQFGDGTANTSAAIAAGIQNEFRDVGLTAAYFADAINPMSTTVASAVGYQFSTVSPIGGITGIAHSGVSPPARRLEVGQVQWYEFTLGQAADSINNRFLLINTHGTDLTLTNQGWVDTEIALYDSSGNLVATDDDGGYGRLSELRFGSQGADGDHSPGKYYLAASALDTTYGSAHFAASSDSAQTGEVEVNLVHGFEFGTLNNGTTTIGPQVIPYGENLFYRFELNDGVYEAYGDSLVIDTQGSEVGSTMAITEDTQLGLFDARGNLIATDDDSGGDFVARLSFGVDGPHGDLPAGTYFLAGAAVAGTFSDDFAASSSPLFTGDFVVNVSLFNLILDGALPGDYNRDGRVDAADYTVWRDALGAVVHTADGDRLRGVDTADYMVWKNNFGATLPISSLTADKVPEPGAVLLLTLGFLVAQAALKNGAVVLSTSCRCEVPRAEESR